MPAQNYSAPTWGGSLYYDLDCPSGAHVQVRRLDLQVIAEADMLAEFDRLSPIVEEKVVAPAKGKKPQDRQPKKLSKKEQAAQEAAEARKLMQGDNMKSLVMMMSRVLPRVIIQPPVRSNMIQDEKGNWVPIDPEDREDGVVYIDTVPFTDQMHILQSVMEGMDMEGMEQFREQGGTDLGDVPAEPEAEVPPV